jgi:hypothetical protein
LLTLAGRRFCLTRPLNLQIAINQDYLAPPGDAVPACKKTTDREAAGSDMGEVWVRKLTDGSMAVAMPNLGAQTDKATPLFRSRMHATRLWLFIDLPVPVPSRLARSLTA